MVPVFDVNSTGSEPLQASGAALNTIHCMNAFAVHKI